MTTRPPAVAGSFYPAASAALDAMVRELLADARPVLPNQAPKALISPHAGYIYSGSTAAHGYAALHPETQPISRVVVACPTHRVGIRGIALPGVDAFATPLGEIPVDTAACERLADFDQVGVRPDVHAEEHALEVQLPFLQVLLGEFELVPLAVGDLPPGQVGEVLDAAWGGPETLIVISSDLSHYLAYEQARQVDAETIDTILRGEPIAQDARACGVRALNGFLATTGIRELEPRLLAACNSGDTAGDRSRVVGYAAIGWYREDTHVA